MKDQSKKVASLKHKEQVEKSKNARLMEEARKREDNLSENSQQVKVSRAFNLTSHLLLLIYAFAAVRNLRGFDSCSEGHSSPEDGAHRRVGGGPEGECSDKRGERDGVGPGGGRQVAPGETGIWKRISTLTPTPLTLSCLLTTGMFHVLFHPLPLFVFLSHHFLSFSTASQKLSVKPVHESNLAHLQWSEVRDLHQWSAGLPGVHTLTAFLPFRGCHHFCECFCWLALNRRGLLFHS